MGSPCRPWSGDSTLSVNQCPWPRTTSMTRGQVESPARAHRRCPEGTRRVGRGCATFNVRNPRARPRYRAHRRLTLRANENSRVAQRSWSRNSEHVPIAARSTRCSPTPARSHARDSRPRLKGARPRPAARMTRIHRLGRTRPHFGQRPSAVRASGSHVEGASDTLNMWLTPVSTRYNHSGQEQHSGYPSTGSRMRPLPESVGQVWRRQRQPGTQRC
jgi:hypothetical protein